MADPAGAGGESVAELLHEGERRVGEVTVDDARLVVTDRRLLVLRAEGTPRQRAIDRANVGAIGVRTKSTRGYLWVAAQWGLLGLFLLGGWRWAPLEALVRPVEAPPDTGLGGLYAAVNQLVGWLAFLDEAFLVGGLLALGWAGLRVVQYGRERERVLEVAVAGAEPLQLPAPDSDEPVDRLRELCGVESE